MDVHRAKYWDLNVASTGQRSGPGFGWAAVAAVRPSGRVVGRRLPAAVRSPVAPGAQVQEFLDAQARTSGTAEAKSAPLRPEDDTKPHDVMLAYRTWSC